MTSFGAPTASGRIASNRQGALSLVMRTLLLLMLGIFLISTPTRANAQIVNILAKLKSEHEQGFAGSLSTSLAWKQGNTNLVQLKGTTALAYQHQRETLFLVAAGSYGLKSTELVVAQVLEHLRYRHTFAEWLQMEAFAQHEADGFRRLSLRVVAGFGPRVRWAWSTPEGAEGPYTVSNFRVEVALASAAMQERELYTKTAAGLSSASSATRWSSYVQIDLFFGEAVSVHHTTFVQPRFDKFQDVRLLSQNALILKANDWFGIKLALKLAYDSRPPADVERLDVALDSALRFSF